MVCARIVLVVWLLLALPCAAALQWSEIMFNPLGADSGKEYIELVGTENLANCTIRDRSSSDILTLNRTGNEVILIVEEDNLVPVGAASVYTAGKAIGNGLDNTYEEIIIACNNQTVLSATYNISQLSGYAEGKTIAWNASWVVGPVNGTPGVVQAISSPQPDNQTPPTAHPVQNLTRETSSTFCNTTLAITVSNTTVHAGEYLLFTIISDAYATFEVLADNETILAGDTISFREYGLVVPEAARLRISAAMRACDSRQRASRVITVLAPPPEPLPALQQNRSVLVAPQSAPEPPTANLAAMPEPQALQSAPPVNAPAEQSAAPSATVTGAMILDTDRNIVPWISAFGIVTLAVSAFVLFRLREGMLEEKAPDARTKYIRRKWGPPRHEGQSDTRIPQQGLDQSDRYIRGRRKAGRARGEGTDGIHREHQKGYKNHLSR